MGQPIAIDSMTFIYLLEKNPNYIVKVRNLFESIRDGRSAILSVIGLIEIQTGAKKKKRFLDAQLYKNQILNFPNLTVKEVNYNIAEISSDLRGKYNISTPDAIHIATAIDAGCSKFITNDIKLKKITEIKVETL